MSPTQDRLHHLFDFDAETGALIWRVRPPEDFATIRAWKRWNTQFSGTVAGCVNGQGYHVIFVDGQLWQLHRLIWIYVNGPIPAGMKIDHVNGKRDYNRLENLRLVTHAQNNRNSSIRSDNTSGVMGVCWYNRGHKWQARIKVNGVYKHLGYFDAIEDAAAARAKAEREYGFHPGHGKKSSRQEKNNV